MPITSPPFTLDLGVYVPNPTTQSLMYIYVNGERIASAEYYAIFSGPYVGMSTRNAQVRINTFEARTHPGGSLVWSDGFVNLSGWTVGHDGAKWYASGGKAANDSYTDYSSVLVRSRGSGAKYWEAKGIEYQAALFQDSWFMIVPFKASTGRTDETAAGGPGDDGYRVYVRGAPVSPGNIPHDDYNITVVNGGLVITPEPEPSTARPLLRQRQRAA